MVVGAPLAGALKKSKPKRPWTRTNADQAKSESGTKAADFAFKSVFIRVRKAFDLQAEIAGRRLSRPSPPSPTTSTPNTAKTSENPANQKHPWPRI